MKKVFCFILAIIMCATMIGCTKQEDPVEKDLEMIRLAAGVVQDKLEAFGIDKEMVDDVIESIEEYNKETDYVIAFNIEMANNSEMKMTVHLPVYEEFFNSVEVGDVVSKDMIEEYVYIDQYMDVVVITVENKIVRE